MAHIQTVPDQAILAHLLLLQNIDGRECIWSNMHKVHVENVDSVLLMSKTQQLFLFFSVFIRISKQIVKEYSEKIAFFNHKI